MRSMKDAQLFDCVIVSSTHWNFTYIHMHSVRGPCYCWLGAHIQPQTLRHLAMNQTFYFYFLNISCVVYWTLVCFLHASRKHKRSDKISLIKSLTFKDETVFLSRKAISKMLSCLFIYHTITVRIGTFLVDFSRLMYWLLYFVFSCHCTPGPSLNHSIVSVDYTHINRPHCQWMVCFGTSVIYKAHPTIKHITSLR